jgi:glycosyltransferase 2 family protein
MYKKRAALFIVSLFLIASLFFVADLGELLMIFSNMGIEAFALLLLLQFLIFFLMSLRWYLIIRRYGASFSHVLQVSFIGFMVNNLTPIGMAGGEPFKAYLISKLDRLKGEKAVATVLVDLFLNIIPALVLLFSATILVFLKSLDFRFAIVLGFIAFLITGLLVASVSTLMSYGPSLSFFRVFLDFFTRIKPLRGHIKNLESKVDEVFASFHRSISMSVKKKTTLASCFFISCLVWGLIILRVYLTFAFIGFRLGLDDVIIIYSLLIVVGVIPLLPGSLGMLEWAGAAILAYFGAPIAVAVAFVLIDRMMFSWFPMLLGALSSFNIGLNLKNILNEESNNS